MRNKRRTDEEWLSFNRAERKAKSYAIGRKNKNEWSSQTIRFYFRFQFPVLYFFSFYCARVLVQIQSLTHLDQIPVRDLCVSAKQLCQGHMIPLCNLGKRISCLNYVITFCKPYVFGRSALRYCYQIITTSL